MKKVISKKDTYISEGIELLKDKIDKIKILESKTKELESAKKLLEDDLKAKQDEIEKLSCQNAVDIKEKESLLNVRNVTIASLSNSCKKCIGGENMIKCDDCEQNFSDLNNFKEHIKEKLEDYYFDLGQGMNGKCKCFCCEYKSN